MSVAKLKVTIGVDCCSLGPHGGTRYKIDTCVKDSRTGMVIDSQHRVGCGLTLKDARKRKKEIIRDFYYFPGLDGDKGECAFSDGTEKCTEEGGGLAG